MYNSTDKIYGAVAPPKEENTLNFLNFGLPSLESLLLLIPAIIISLTVHEFCHGYAAYRLGDHTAKTDGRLSFNPIRHIDPIGLLMIIWFRIGWAKPVMVDPYNLKSPKQDMAIIAAAGPISNLVLSFITMLILAPVFILTHGHNNVVIGYLIEFLVVLASINIGLALFNLIPIPPLDGSKIFAFFLPTDLYFRFISFRWGFILILSLAFFGVFSGVLQELHQAIFNAFWNASMRIFGFLI